MSDVAIEQLAVEVLARARAAGVMVATAESCTGGLVAAALTGIAGSSDVVDRGFVTYSNEAKREMLGVPRAVLDAYGAVSAQTARAMAEGALSGSRAGLAVSITGIAGPGGGSVEKPVGLVHFGLARRGAATITVEKRFGDIGRDKVRAESVLVALGLLRDGAISASSDV
jgi:nicotinamide-nucleotide amidase